MGLRYKDKEGAPEREERARNEKTACVKRQQGGQDRWDGGAFTEPQAARECEQEEGPLGVRPRGQVRF